MTDNNTVDKLNNVQTRLTALASSVNKIAVAAQDLNHSTTLVHQELAKLLPMIESASHDVAWKDAQSSVTPTQPTTAAELLAVFKNAMRNGVQAAPQTASVASQVAPTHTPVKDISNTSPGLYKAASQAASQVATPFATLAGLTLTDQARELLKTHTYFGAIDALHKLHPSAQRDNIRRAVARADGR